MYVEIRLAYILLYIQIKYESTDLYSIFDSTI